MTALALILVLAAAFAHSLWNFLAKKASGGLPFVWIFTGLASLIYFPVATGVFLIQRPHLGLPNLLMILATAAVHSAYFLLLDMAYRTGDMSLAYPIARGTRPAPISSSRNTIAERAPVSACSCGDRIDDFRHAPPHRERGGAETPRDKKGNTLRIGLRGYHLTLHGPRQGLCKPSGNTSADPGLGNQLWTISNSHAGRPPGYLICAGAVAVKSKTSFRRCAA